MSHLADPSWFILIASLHLCRKIMGSDVVQAYTFLKNFPWSGCDGVLSHCFTPVRYGLGSELTRFYWQVVRIHYKINCACALSRFDLQGLKLRFCPMVSSSMTQRTKLRYFKKWARLVITVSVIIAFVGFPFQWLSTWFLRSALCRTIPLSTRLA